MRTDSVNLSTLALATSKEVIAEQYGEKYVHTRQFRTKAKGAQEAHEAIRPTYMNVMNAGEGRDEQRLYELIWKRTIASQMAEAESEKTIIEVSVHGSKYAFVATGEVITFDGFTKVYVQSTDDAEEERRILPAMSQRERLKLVNAEGIQTYAKPPFRYNEAALVKRMEELVIGRPSTYATIIETIQKVKYVERGSVAGQKRDVSTLTLKNGMVQEKQKSEQYGADNQKLLPTDLGRITNDFLVEHFPSILSYDFTAHEEEQFDKIAVGRANWIETVDTFYKTFKPLLSSIPSGKMEGRVLGNDPATGLPVIAKISKIGPCIQLGDATTEKPRFASLKKGQSIYSITLNEALELFRTSLPMTIGEYDGKEVIVGEGKYGPYVHYDNLYISIPRTKDPLTVKLEEAIAMIEEKKEASMPIHDWGDIKVLRSKYGAYIHTPEGNYRIAKSTDVEQLTEAEVKQIIAQSEPLTPGKRTFKRKSAK
jgi:DNA topoisomerase-1